MEIIETQKKKYDSEQQALAGRSSSSSSFDDLPDEVIQHIISFLPTKYVVQTSLLSRRWRYLWTRVPRLEFIDGQMDGSFDFITELDYKLDLAGSELFDLVHHPDSFDNFVDEVMSRHCSNVESFHLMRFSSNDASKIGNWISGAISRNVQEFYLATSVTVPRLMVAKSLFECKSLTSLTIKAYDSILTLPATIHLPMLKLLTFDSVCITVANNNNLLLKKKQNHPHHDRCLLVNAYFPRLEDLALAKCLFGDILLSISVPLLKNLYLSECGAPPVEGSSKDKCKVMISAPNITSMECFGPVFSYYHIENHSSSLVKGFFNLSIIGVKRRTVEAVSNAIILFDLAVNTKTLWLSSNTIRTLSQVPQTSVLDKLPIFHNLKDLQLTAYDCRGHVQVICQFVHRIPILEFLSVDFYKPDDVNGGPDQQLLLLPFKLVGNCLKEVHIDNVNNNLSKIQLEFIECILEDNDHNASSCSSSSSSPVLERMEFKLRRLRERDEMVLKEVISKHPRVSSVSSHRDLYKNIIVTIHVAPQNITSHSL